MIKAVLFDMDGTLFDTESMIRAGWAHLVDEGLAPREIISLYPATCGIRRVEVDRMMREWFGEDFPLEDRRRRISEWIREQYDLYGVPLKKGMPQILGDLKDMGLSLALVTSTSEGSVADYMKRTGIGDYFGTIVTGGRVQNGKPAPDCYLLAAKELGVAPDACVVVEDAPSGLLAGHRAGMKTVMIPDLIRPNEQTKESTTVVCRDLFEMVEWVRASLQTREKEKDA